MSKPRVLVLVDWFWPGFRAGGPIRSTHNLIRWLQDKVEFSVITSDRDHLSHEPYAEVKANAWNTTPDGIRVYYASLGSFSKEKLKELVLAERPDFILMNSMFSRPFTLWPLQLWAKEPRGMKLLLAPRGMLAAGALSVKSTKKRLFLSYFKLKQWHKAVTFVATGEHEAADTRHIFGAEMQIQLAPNLPEPALPPIEILHKGGETIFLSVARISPEKNNLWMLEQFSRLQTPARLILIGPVGNEEYGSRCERAMQQMPPHLQVEMRGPQPPAQVQATMQQSHFLLLPTLGENFGHAIIEALSLGKPVIISDKTPWRGLEADKAGWDLPLVDKAFVETLEKAALMRMDEYQSWSEGARNRAMAFLHNPVLAEQNMKVFNL